MVGNSGSDVVQFRVLLALRQHRGSPGGPKDTIPPKVMGATPAFNTTNFTGTRIYITFDEYVQLKDQQKEFFTSPQLKRHPPSSSRGGEYR